MSERNRIRILVVDDLADATDSMTLLLGLWGYDAEGCYDGPSALKTAVTYRPHVVLLDVAMPRMDGFQVARRLRALLELANTVIIGISGYANESYSRRARAAGFDRFLVKPVEPCLLEELLNHVASGAGLPDDGGARQQAGAVSGTPSSALIGSPLLRFEDRRTARRFAIEARPGAKVVALIPP